MTLHDIARKLFDAKRAEATSKASDMSTLQGTVVSDSADGSVEIAFDGDCTTMDGTNVVRIGTLAALKEGDQAIVLLEGGGVKRPTAIGSAGWGDRITASIVDTQLLIASKADIEDLEAANGHIENLEVDNLTINEKLTLAETSIGNLEADTATIKGNLSAATAKIGTLEADNATINGKLTAAEADIDSLEADNATINGKLTAAEADIDSLEAETATITGTLNAHDAVIENLDANYAHITEGVIDNATIGHADVDGLNANYAHITSGSIDNATIDQAKVNNLSSNYAHITNGVIDNATIGYADVDNLSAHYAEITNGHINSALIDTAAIVDEQVFTVTGNKATISEINADTITVRNLHTSNLTVDTADGYVTIGNKKTPTKEYIDSLKDELQQEIDGAVETWTSAAVPLMSNYPTTQWALDPDDYDTQAEYEEAQRKAYAKHVGDICYVQQQGSDYDGFCYRFSYSNGDFSWVLIKDSSVTKALGEISELQTFESETTSWIDETEEGLTTIRQNHTALSGVVDKTVKSSTQLWYTKANTTAPTKPTARVTSTATTGNGWRTVVPAWNASYPNYYYCWQFELADGTYSWSDVVRDIAMGESQGTSRDAQATADANIKSSVQLWFTKANSTAPAKPTAQVTTNNPATGNAWNLAVPTYSASYPHYFYCYQQQKGDGTYQWSDVVYDKGTTEAMQKAQAALPSSTFTTFQQNTFKELVDEVDEQSSTITTMGEAISSSANLVNGTSSEWRELALTNGTNQCIGLFSNFDVTEIPNIKADDKISVSFDVKYATGTTRTQESGYPTFQGSCNAGGTWRSIGPNSTLHSELLAAISGADEVYRYSTYFTVTEYMLNGTYSGICDANLRHDYTNGTVYVRKVMVNRGSIGLAWTPSGEDTVALTNTVNSVRQTADANSASITDLTSIATNNGLTKTTNITSRASTIEQNLSGITTRVAATETELETVANPNLGPYFAHDFADLYNATTNPDGYWRVDPSTSNTGSGNYTQMEDGWAHLVVDNTSGTDNRYGNIREKVIDELKPSTEYTAVLEVRNLSKSGTITWQGLANRTYAGAKSQFATGQAVQITADGTYRSKGTSRDSFSDCSEGTSGYITIPKGASVDVEVRYSLYEGDYAGPFKPYVDPTLSSRVTQAETEIEQNKGAIALRATKTETYQAAQPNLAPMFSSHNADGTYPNGGTGGYWQPSSDKAYNRSFFTALEDGWMHVEAANTVQKEFVPARVDGLVANDRVTMLVEWRNATWTGNGAAFYSRNYAGNVQLPANWYPSMNTASGEARHTYTVSTADGTAAWNGLINWTFTAASGGTWTGDIRISFYKEVHDSNTNTYIQYAGPYKPYSGSQLYASQAELKVANDAISARVEKDGVIAAINASVEQSGGSAVKISADKVNIEGATIFTSGRLSSTSLNNAYDAKGSASAVQSNLDNLQIGGTNYILNSAGVLASGLGSEAGSMAEYRAVNLGQSYMSIPHGTQVTVSFDLYMTVNTANPYLQVYNTNNKGPKAFSNSATGSGAAGGLIINFTATAGSVINKRVSVTGYINDRTSPTIKDNFLEFYSNYGSSNWFSISNLKLEKGSKATDWTEAPENRNLLLGTGVAKTSPSLTLSSSNWTAYNYYRTYKPYNQIVKVGDFVTVSFDWATTSTGGNFHVECGTSSPYTWGTVINAMGTRSKTSNYVDVSSSNVSGHVAITFQAASSHVSAADTLEKLRIRFDDAAWAGKTMTLSNAKVEMGSMATGWTPAPEDTVTKTQRIYYRSSSSSAPTAPSTWVTESGNKWAANDTTAANWSTKVTPIANGTGASVTKYLYLYTCVQTVSGTGVLTNSEVLLDDSTTVIDGGNIITGSVTANKLNANNINASKVLTVGALSDDAQAKLTGSGFTIQWDANQGTSYAGGEARICLRDPLTGTVTPNTAGWVMFNGVKRTVPYSDFNPNAALPYNIPIYMVLRLSSETSTTGTMYAVFYSSGWKVASAMSSPTTTYTDWAWTEATDLILGKCVEPASEAVFTECEIYDPPLTAKAVSSATVTAASANSAAAAADTKATNAAKTATNYITADSSGIKVHNASDTTNYVHQSSNGTKVYKGGYLKANYADTISLYGGSNASGAYPKAEISSTAVKMYQNANNHADVDSTGLTVYQGGKDVASFGSTTRVGKSNNYHVEITDSSFALKDSTITLIKSGIEENEDYAIGEWLFTDSNPMGMGGGYNGGYAVSEMFVPKGTGFNAITLESDTNIGDFSYYVGLSDRWAHDGNKRVFRVDKNGNLTIKGAISLGTALTAAQIPNLNTSKLTAGTLGVERGGTGKTAGTCYMATAIYAFNASGTSGTVTLTETAANFTFVDIFFKGNDGYYDFTRVYSPNGKVVNLSTMESTANGAVNCKWKAMTISGTSITNKYYGEMDNGGTPASVNHIYVCGVIGYK